MHLQHPEKLFHHKMLLYFQDQGISDTLLSSELLVYRYTDKTQSSLLAPQMQRISRKHVMYYFSRT